VLILKNGACFDQACHTLTKYEVHFDDHLQGLVLSLNHQKNMYDIIFCLITISRLDLWRVTEENAATSVGGLLHTNCDKKLQIL